MAAPETQTPLFLGLVLERNGQPTTLQPGDIIAADLEHCLIWINRSGECANRVLFGGGPGNKAYLSFMPCLGDPATERQVETLWIGLLVFVAGGLFGLKLRTWRGTDNQSHLLFGKVREQ